MSLINIYPVLSDYLSWSCVFACMDIHLEASKAVITFGNWLFSLSIGNIPFLYSALVRVPSFISEVKFMSALSCTGSKTWIFPRWQISEKGCRSGIFLPLKKQPSIALPYGNFVCLPTLMFPFFWSARCNTW